MCKGDTKPIYGGLLFASMTPQVLNCPMKTEKTTTKTTRTPVQRIARVALKTVLFILLFVVLIALSLLLPPVQKFAAHQAANYLERKLHTKVTVGSVFIGLPRRVILRDVYMEDQTKDTLIYGGTVKADLDIFKIFSNNIQVSRIEFDDITTKVKRLLPDTTFNFQFVVDAFSSKTGKTKDTTTSTPMTLAVNNIILNNVNVLYKDVITGNDMTTHIGALNAKIDSLDLTAQRFAIPLVDVNGMTLRFYQATPLVTPKTAVQAAQQAAQPLTTKLNLGTVHLKNVSVDYGNDMSDFYTKFNFGDVTLKGRSFDLQNNQIALATVRLDNTASAIRIGRKPGAQVLKTEAKKTASAQAQNPWVFRIDNLELNNNLIQFDDDNKPKQPSGIDFSHFKGDNMTLQAQRLVVTPDSLAGLIAKGSFKEKSGFQLDALTADFYYGLKQAYIKNLYIKTPGTEIKRSMVLNYTSQEDLVKNFAKTQMNIDLRNSHVQVKDILAFAPQLKSQPAFANPGAVWNLNIQGSGNMDRLTFQSLQFSGLKNTSLDAYGTLSGATNPKAAGGTFTIRRLYTSQSDIATFTGKRLSNAQMNLPENFNISGTVSGNMHSVSTNLAMATADGNVGINGTFTNPTDPKALTYNATITTRSLQVGRIMRNSVPVGSLTATIHANGKGTDPKTISTTFNGAVQSVVYNGYNYRNIKLDGSLHGSAFNVTTVARDPNLSFNLKASGNTAGNSSFHVTGFIDSVKTMPLHFTTEPLVFRGRINADVAGVTADYLDANVLITEGLVVSRGQRAPIDSLSFVSGHYGQDQFMKLTSSFANASMQGRYSFADLGNIIQNNIQPYFAVSKGSKLVPVKPYDFNFRLDVVNSPLLKAFMPTLDIPDNIHAEGSLATGQGLQAKVTSPNVTYGTNSVSGLDVQVNTTSKGLEVVGNVGHIISGSKYNIYNTRLTATVNNNIVDFNFGVRDKSNKPQYHLSGTLTQPQVGTYALALRPDSMLLNYERWSIAGNNQLIISPTNIGANNFTLSKGNQSLSLQSQNGTTGPLTLNFTNFRLGTLTGFLKADTVLADGTLNGVVTFQNLTQSPLFSSNLNITELSFRKDTIGNVSVQARSTSANNYTANIAITGHGNDVQLSGTATKLTNDIGLDMNLDVRTLQLKSLQGALASFVTRADGTINGNVRVNGTTSAPKVNGDLNFNKATISTVALGGPLTIDNEKLSVTEKGFTFNNFAIKDSANNALTLNGTVATSNFMNYNFNLDVNAENFRALNTDKKANSLYYGKLFINTNLHVGGTELNPVVDGNISVNKGTQFSIVIPQSEPGIVQREGVVEFVDFKNPGVNDSLFRNYDSLNKSSVMGFDVATNISISKDANFNVIVDVANGDFLNLRGTGQLTAGVDPSGKITLTGSYEIEEGAYQLAFNMLRRRFDIEKGSKITWLGEPTNAELNVTAKYIANTAPLDLVEQQIQETSQRNYYLQKLPFNILLSLKGMLMQPDLTFDITLPPEQNYNVNGDVISTVNTRLAQLRQEPSELNKQVFAIMLLNRFVGENPFQSSGGGFSAGTLARTSVSKMLTEQLNNLAGGLVQGVDINFDVASSDDYTTGEKRSRTDLNVGVSKRLLNDRLTVTVGSNFELEGPQQSNQSSNNIAGNIAVNYQLSPDGRYMLRFYRRNDYEGLVDGYVIETGIGFIISVDYNRFREIWQGRKIKRDVRKANKQNGTKTNEPNKL